MQYVYLRHRHIRNRIAGENNVKKSGTKTNAVRILDNNKIAYELRYYEIDESDFTGIDVAEAISMPAPQVFKTLVVRGDRRGIVLACIPTDQELDLKAIARFTGNKKTELVPMKELKSLTGYIRGGVSPVGTTRAYPVIIDECAWEWDIISLSAGMPGIQMLVNPCDLDKVVDITFERITR